jgi:hypothetical protein
MVFDLKELPASPRSTAYHQISPNSTQVAVRVAVVESPQLASNDAPKFTLAIQRKFTLGADIPPGWHNPRAHSLWPIVPSP